MPITSKDYARPLSIEKEISEGDYSPAIRLAADQGHALRGVIAAAAKEIVYAIEYHASKQR